MTRQHKTLQDMVHVAENQGVSERGNWKVTFDKFATGNLKDIYPKYQVEETTAIITVIHWGTPILEIYRTGYGLGEYEYSHKILHGQSISDSNAINALLDYHGIDEVYTTFRPVNGGFMIFEKEV